MTPYLQLAVHIEIETHKRALSCRSFVAKEPLIIGLFCGKWPGKIRHPMGLGHPVTRGPCPSALRHWKRVKSDLHIEKESLNWEIQRRSTHACGLSTPVSAISLICTISSELTYFRNLRHSSSYPLVFSGRVQHPLDSKKVFARY